MYKIHAYKNTQKMNITGIYTESEDKTDCSTNALSSQTYEHSDTESGWTHLSPRGDG